MRTPHPSPKRATVVPRAGPQSVGRIVLILDSIAGTRSGLSLSDLARITQSPKTSLVGLLAGLMQEGCLLRDDGGRYHLGPRMHRLAIRAVAGREFAQLVRPVLESLVAATGETAVLGTLAPDEDVALYVDAVESPNSIRYAVKVGERRDLYCTALGKALLAHFEAARLRRYLKETPRRKYTAATLTSVADLTAEMARIRREGISRSDGERVAGASALSAPIFDDAGGVAWALLVAGPADRMRANAAANERALREAAAECTRLIGGTPAG
jgi:DNA-binding IclR family transcriptional regulator